MATGELVEIDDARRMVLAATGEPLGAEETALGIEALGRVLREDVTATEPVPAFDNSAMDGFAVRSDDLTAASPQTPVTLRLVDESRAGTPAARALAACEAIAISTGAMTPAGADAILRLEDASRDGHSVQALAAPVPGEHVRRAGEDVVAGTTVLCSGATLGPIELGVLASLGRARIRCARRPRVAVLVSGDELLDPGEPMRLGGVRDTSSLGVAALARCAGAEVVPTARVGDDAVQTRNAIAAALAVSDVTVVCGGVSVGPHDHVRPALTELGAREIFWGLALKPGRPAWFGTLDEKLVFGLPGNPVSALVTFTLLVAPALRALLGAREGDARATAILDADYHKRDGRMHALRCRLRAADDGWHAELTGPQGSHVLTSMLGADALAFMPSESTLVNAGERVAIEPLWSWGGGWSGPQ